MMTGPEKKIRTGTLVRIPEVHVIFGRKNTLPFAVFDIHDVCNQNCAYCVSSSSPSPDWGSMGDPERRGAIEQFFRSHGPFNVVFTGGEPVITPRIADFFQLLLDEGHRVSLQTNLKKSAAPFYETVPVEKTGWVLATFHSVALDRVDSFLKHALEIKERGYPLVVKFLLDEVLMPEFARLNDRLAENGIGVMCSPVINYPPGGQPFPHRYTPEEWQQIAPRITLLSTWLFFAGGWHSQGTPCNAGNRMIYLRGKGDGAIHGCSSGSPAGMGNLFNNELLLPGRPVPCQLDRCVCDFHYYTGIIPRLDDSEAFARLAQGRNRRVSYREFKKWMEKAGVEPLVDLELHMGEEEPAAVL
jgi:organic radical activating enzyme